MNDRIKLSVQNIVKKYNKTAVLDNVSIDIEKTKFFALLGPSGSGKTTLLRMIAGFVKPDSGRILMEEEDITQKPPNRRNMAMVFQNYSLWPHMTVFENVAFGLRLRKLPPQVIEEKVRKALMMIHLEKHMSKKPQQLSGGQQQRVALARALVVEPKILLLDEPLSNLDANLRDQLRHEIKSLHRNLGITTIYVTHDQKEAVYLADVIAIMLDGNIIETGSPEELYRKPEHPETARFFGQLNEFSGVVKQVEKGRCIVDTQLGDIQVVTQKSFNQGEKIIICFRPEFVQYPVNRNPVNKFECEIVSYKYTGSFINVVLKKSDVCFKAALSPALFKPDEMKKCLVGIESEDILIFRNC